LDTGAWRQVSANQKYFKLNEHGPELNVFWTRHSELGARSIERKTKTKKLLNKKKKQKSFSDPALEPDG